MESTREDFVCKRCGLCCQEETLPKCFWTGGDLTWQEKQDLLKERKKYPPNDKGCEMVYFEDKIAYCLVWVMFGKEKIESVCIHYPKDKLCVREIKEKEAVELID